MLLKIQLVKNDYVKLAASRIVSLAFVDLVLVYLNVFSLIEAGIWFSAYLHRLAP